MVDPIYLSESTRSRYLQRRNTAAYRWPTQTDSDGSVVLRAAMRFWVEWSAAMVSFHASLLKGGLSHLSRQLQTPENE